MTREYADIWVCVDCYFAHHYGYRSEEMADGGDGMRWLIGPDFDPDRDMTDLEPLRRCGDLEVSDNTDSENDEGIDTFSSRSCDGCGSHLGGSRYRLALWIKEDA